MKCLFDRTDFENLTSYFNTSERYIRGNFVYELSAHSPVRTHCVTFALSDSKTKPFSQKCPENDHMEKCSNCQLLPQAIQILRNMIEVLYNNKAITHYDYVEFVYDTVDAHSKIQAYIFHLIRNHQSNNVWKTMMDRQVEGDVFVTFDFAMKFLPRVSQLFVYYCQLFVYSLQNTSSFRNTVKLRRSGLVRLKQQITKVQSLWRSPWKQQFSRPRQVGKQGWIGGARQVQPYYLFQYGHHNDCTLLIYCFR